MAYIYHCHLLPCVLRRFLSPCAHATRPTTPRTPPPPRPTSVVATASRASAVPMPPRAPMTSRRQLLPALARRAGHTVPSSALTRRDDEAANVRGFLYSIPEVRTYILRRQRFSATVVCACLVVRKFVRDLAILNNAVAALMSGDLEQLGEGVLS